MTVELSAGQLVEDIQPLADYLTDALGIPVTGTVTNDYTGLVTASTPVSVLITPRSVCSSRTRWAVTSL